MLVIDGLESCASGVFGLNLMALKPLNSKRKNRNALPLPTPVRFKVTLYDKVQLQCYRWGKESKTMQKFKSYTAYELLKLLEKKNVTTLLKQFAFHKKAHRKENITSLTKQPNIFLSRIPLIFGNKDLLSLGI